MHVVNVIEGGRRTCDLGNVRDGQPLHVVSWTCQALCHVRRLEIQLPVVFVQRLRKPGGRQEDIKSVNKDDVKVVKTTSGLISRF